MDAHRDLSRKAFIAAALFESTLLGVGLVLGSLTNISPLASLQLDVTDAALGLVLTLPPLGFLAWFVRTDWAPLLRIRETLDETFVPAFRHCTWDEIVALALVAGVGEEVFFRGWMQAWLHGQAGPLAALLIASALFGIAHAVTRAYAVLAGAIGLYLGAAFLVTDNLLTPIVIHALYDAVALWTLLRRPRGNTVPPADAPDVERDGPPPPD